MKSTLPLLILLLLLGLPSDAQSRKKLDSLFATLPYLNDSLKVKTYLNLAYQYQNIDEDSALMLAHAALAIAKQTDKKKWIGFTYRTIASLHSSYQTQLDSAIYYYQLAKHVFSECNDSIHVAFILNDIRYNLQLQHNDKQAFLYNDSASVIFQALHDHVNFVETLMTKTEYYTNTKDYDKARDLIREMFILNSKNKLGDYNLSRINLMAGSFFSEVGQSDSAVFYLTKALHMAEKTGDLRGISYDSGVLGVAYSKSGKWDQAIRYVQQGLKLAQENHFVKETQNNLLNLYFVYRNKGDSKNALKYYEQYNTLTDSLNTYFLESSLNKVNMELNNVKNVKKIELLNKENELQQSEVSKQRLLKNGTLVGLAIVFGFAFVFFFQRKKIAKEKHRSEELLLNILPTEVAEELKQKGSADAKQFDQVTVMFTDFKGFTQISEKLSPVDLVNEIHLCFKVFDDIIGKYNIEKIKTIGDAYMCAGGLPVANTTNATDVVNAALEIQQFMLDHLNKKSIENKETFEIRIGIHTGPVVAGIVGVKKFAYDIWGDTVNIASRMESSGEAGKVNISDSTFELVKNQFYCTPRGKIQAKNKGEIEMYFVVGRV